MHLTGRWLSNLCTIHFYDVKRITCNFIFSGKVIRVTFMKHFEMFNTGRYDWLMLSTDTIENYMWFFFFILLFCYWKLATHSVTSMVCVRSALTTAAAQHKLTHNCSELVFRWCSLIAIGCTMHSYTVDCFFFVFRRRRRRQHCFWCYYF